jgi:hypothetical protein
MWSWFGELRSPARTDDLVWLFAQGRAGEAPDGDCEGTVMELHGATWLSGLDAAVRMGRRLGGIGWTGKSFDAEHGTGYNRLTLTTFPVALIVMPTYRLRRADGELIGFDFHHRLEASPFPDRQQVRAITYDAPEHDNPLVLPRTRDEIVEVAPGVHLGRVLLKVGDAWQLIGHFGLRAPRRTTR